MSDNIPFDIQAQIIKSLPVKSLIRFRLVSKQWDSFIGSSKFIAEYQTHQKRRHHLLVSLVSTHNFDEKYVSIVDDDTFPQHKFSLTFPPSVHEPLERPDIISSQGLLFVHRYDEVCSGTVEGFIWNPIIRKSVDIEVCIEPRPDILTLGFGVCPDTCDPKIVKYTWYQNHWGSFFEVFALSTNAWRRLSKNLPRECVLFTPNQVAIDRFMYWIAYEMIYADNGYQWIDTKRFIVSFDMTSEEFTEISLPASLAAGAQTSLKIHNIRESLVVVQFKIEAGKRVHSVWKMMEHGASKSFTKLYTIDVIKLVHGFRKSGEPIVEKENDGRKDFFAYDPDSKHINFIGISREGYSYISVISYIETLLLLDH